MKSIASRLLTLLAAVLAAVSVSAQPPTENIDPSGGSGTGGGCYACLGTYDGNTGVMYLRCGSPEPGGWGNQYCSMTSDGSTTYCQVYGNDCCID